MKFLIFIALISIGQYAVAQTCGGYSMVNSTTTALVPPPEPLYEVCETRTTDSDGQEIVKIDQNCLARNQQKQQAFGFQSNCYNQAKQMQQQVQQAAQTAEQQRLAAQAQLNSSKAAAEAAQQKNKEGSQIYQLASMGCEIASGYYAAAFAASCSGGATCQYGLLAKSLAFAAFSMLASKQASSHDNVANNACVAASQMSSEGGECGGAPAPYNPQTFPSTITGNGPGTIGSIFDSNGKCVGNPADCQTIISNLPPGMNLKDGIKGIKSFANDTGKKPFKIDKDGNLVTEAGTKFKPEDLSNEKSLVVAGLSAAEAKSLLAHINKAGSVFDAKAALAKENAKDSNGGAFGDAGGSLLKGNAQAANGAAGSGKNIGGGRDPASAEGLAKDFNGDMIGVAGDDIFKMMNRRYKLKSSQDNFIAP